MYAENAGLVEVVTEVVEAGKSIVNEAQMPQKYWKKDDTNYGKSMIHLPPVLGGVGDGVIDEVTEKIQFVQMGLSLVQNPGQIKEAWNTGREAIGKFKFAEFAGGLQTQLTALLTGTTDDDWHTRGQKTVELTLAVGGLPKITAGLLAAAQKQPLSVQTVLNAAKKKFSLTTILNRSTLRNAILHTAESKNVAQDYFASFKLKGLIPNTANFDDWYANEFKRVGTQSNLSPFQSHHLIPENIVKNNDDFKKFLEWEHANNKNWDYAGEDNGLMLSVRNKNVNPEPFPGDHGNHPQYDAQVRTKVQQITDTHIGLNPLSPNYEAVLTELKAMNQKIKTQLRDEVVKGDKIVNNIILNLN